MCFPISESRSRRRGDRGDPEFYNLLFIYLIFLAYGGTSGQEGKNFRKYRLQEEDRIFENGLRRPDQISKSFPMQRISRNFCRPENLPEFYSTILKKEYRDQMHSRISKFPGILLNKKFRNWQRISRWERDQGHSWISKFHGCLFNEGFIMCQRISG